MLNDLFSELRFPIDWETFQRLPRHPAYRYQYLNGQCEITGHPVYYHAELNLEQRCEALDSKSVSRFEIAPLADTAQGELSPLFCDAFSRTVPFRQMQHDERLRSTRLLLDRVFSGTDGPLVPEASFVVRNVSDAKLAGAILVTLVPDADLTDFTDPAWEETPPDNPIPNRWGRPHLTWIFVEQRSSRKGLATALLSASAGQLHRLGYSQLASTFLLGDHVSLLWHWKSAFRLLSHISSQRG